MADGHLCRRPDIRRVSPWAVLVFSLFAASAMARTSIPELALDTASEQRLGEHLVHFIDVDKQLDASGIAGGAVTPDWQPSDSAVPNLGLTNDRVWFAVWLTSLVDLKRLLVVNYPPLDFLDVFLLREGQLQQHFSTGDRLPFASRPLGHRNFVFPLEFGAGERYLMLLRVETSGSLQLPATLWDANHFIEESQQGLILQLLFIGIILALAAYHLLLCLAVRDSAYWWYVAFLATFLLAQVTLRGLGLQYLWPNSPEFNHLALPFFFALSFVVTCLFTHNFLDVPRHSQTWSRVLRGMAWAGLPVVGMSLLLPYGITLVAILVGSTLGSVIIFLCGCQMWARGNAQAPFFVLAWSLFLAGNVLFNMSKTGLLPSNDVTEYLPQIGTVLQMLLLSFALAYRINLEREKREKAQRRALTLQGEANAALESRVAERTEELERAYDKLKAISQIDGLTQLKNRAFFDQTLQAEWSRHSRESLSLALLLIDADHFKAINDRYGHLCGDECLRYLAETCRDRLRRPGDLIARYGGEEFVALLPATEVAGAKAVAEDIRQGIAAGHFEWQGQAIPLTVSIGIAAWVPHREQLPQDLLHQADEALYAAKAAGRNQVVAYQQPSTPRQGSDHQEGLPTRRHRRGQ